MSKFLPNSDEILSCIRSIQPSKIAVAYIGRDFYKFVDPSWIEQIVVSPTPSSNPHAVAVLSATIGWNRIQFIPELHAKMYLGRNSAVVASANLSRNGLGIDGLWEVGVYVDDPAMVQQIESTFDSMVAHAEMSYPNVASKESALFELLQSYVSRGQPSRKDGEQSYINSTPTTLADVLASVGESVPPYEVASFWVQQFNTSLGRITWRYLNADQTIKKLVDSVLDGKPAVSGIDEQFPTLFSDMLSGPEVDNNQVKKMIGHMVSQVVARYGYRVLKRRVWFSGKYFSHGATYQRFSAANGQVGDDRMINWSLYWSAFRDRMESSNSPIRFRAPRNRRYFDSAGRSDVGLTAVALTQSATGGCEIRAELVLYPPKAKQVYDVLLLEQSEIESELISSGISEELEWHGPDGVNKRIIRIRKSENGFSPASWEKQHAWLKVSLEGLHLVLMERAIHILS